MSRKNIKNVYLAEKIMEEILSRLPVKSLLRFRCVSKSWLSLISSQRFMKTLDNSTKNRVVIFRSVQDHEFKQCPLQQLLEQPSSIEPPPIYDPMNHQLLTIHACVVGCCNGLICILNPSANLIHLWNAATMIYKALPKLEGYRCRRKIGFGWDGTIGAYKVFALTDHPGTWNGNVYSSKTNSWKTVDGGCLNVHCMFGTYACGKLHWPMVDQDFDYIEFFDLESEAFGRTELPFKQRNCRCSVAEIRGCLHLVCVDNRDYDRDQQSYLEIWVMKGSCWLKLATLSLTKFPFFGPNYFRYRPKLFGGGPNGEILLVLSDIYLIYDSNNDWQLLGAGKMRTGFNSGHDYAESLYHQILQ